MAYLLKSDDPRTWDLTGYRATQLRFDAESFRVEAWTLSATFDVRIGTPFQFTDVNGVTIELDPENSLSLAPLLALVGNELQSLTVTRIGGLTLQFADGARLVVSSHPAFEAWEVRGGGALEHVGYLASPGSGSPWG